MQRIVIYLVLIGTFIVGGYSVGDKFMSYSISLLHLDRVEIFVTSIDARFNQALYFGLTLGTVPLSYFLINQFIKRLNSNETLLFLGLTVFSGISGWWFRVAYLRGEAKELSNLITDPETIRALNYSELHFSLYLFIGLFLGAAISTLTFWKMNKRSNSV